MIKSIEVQNIRGIRSGKLDDLTPIVILVGPNACGKSTLLDAMLIGASPDVGAAIKECVNSRRELQSARWLLHWRASGEHARIVLVNRQDKRRMLKFMRLPMTRETEWKISVRPDSQDEQSADINAVLGDAGPVMHQNFFIPFAPIADVHLVQTFDTRIPLHSLYTNLVQRGRRDLLLDMLKRLVPSILSLEILTPDGNTPILHCGHQQQPIPVAMTGDGIAWLVRLACNVVTEANNLVLVEEPETHLHPGAQREAAKLFRVSAEQGVQICMTTHSLDFIDAMIDGAANTELERISLYRLSLQNGHLKSSRLDGRDIATARFDIASDLR